MRILLDTHLLLWLAYEPELLSRRANEMFAVPENSFVFSVVSIWEVAIKKSLRKPGFSADSRRLREGLLRGGMEELTVVSSHAIAVEELPLLHRDPFDRLLIAQGVVEHLAFATVDEGIGRYSANILYVG